jgi:hypothetical protein
VACKVLQRGVGDPRGGEPGADGFQLGHHLEHLDQFDRPGLAHEHAAARDLLDQPGERKPLKRLAIGVRDTSKRSASCTSSSRSPSAKVPSKISPLELSAMMSARRALHAIVCSHASFANARNS